MSEAISHLDLDTIEQLWRVGRHQNDGTIDYLVGEVRRLRQQVAEKPLAWTKERPTVPGFWHWRGGPLGEWAVVKVYYPALQTGPGRLWVLCPEYKPMPLDNQFWAGEWAGPLQPPAS